MSVENNPGKWNNLKLDNPVKPYSNPIKNYPQDMQTAEYPHIIRPYNNPGPEIAGPVARPYSNPGPAARTNNVGTGILGRISQGLESLRLMAKNFSLRYLTSHTTQIDAARSGNIDTLQFIDKATAQSLLSHSGTENMLTFLLSKGAEINDKAISAAITSNNIASIGLLLSHPSFESFEEVNERGPYKLIEAFNLAKGQVDMQKRIAAVYVGRYYDSDLTILINELPSRKMALDIINVLPENADSINAISDATGDTPLLMAAWLGDVSLINALLEKGADINKIGDEKMTPLEIAISRKKEKAINVLLDHNSNS